ncbi:DUF4382 domain-containing protein [Aegicerativicinus sediminis]|uniref:DUF4382 domain-containing protein n=1 Tax=Aegicerativicinus sediminis TaxID=2893202 RepID=UPI001E4EE9E0|nr:DUF4382 domain-containing protein [Aegicerativicinus sediminis]
MNLLKTLMLSCIAVVAIFFTSCSDNDSNGGAEATSRISVRLMDAPGDYDAINIEVVDVMVRYGDTEAPESDDEGWVSLNPQNTGVYDLLELVAGNDLLLVDDYEVPAGYIEQIRLVLGDDNEIFIDNVRHDLKTPSAQQSGLKIKVDQEMQAGYYYTFLLDFDADKSIVMAGGSDNIILKPVMRASIEAYTGVIAGQIDPAIPAEVSAVSDGDPIVTYTNDEGYFMIYGATPGNYTITITPEEGSGYLPAIIENVAVELEQTTQMEIVTLELE